jgi:NTE family protein
MAIALIKDGFYRGAGNSSRALDLKSRRVATPSEYDALSSDQEVALASTHPTDLRALTMTAFDRIAVHGYEVAGRTLTTYVPQHFAL